VGSAAEALGRLLELPEVADGVERARQACAGLARHPAMRRRADEVGAEARVRAAHASAALDGARLPLAAVREAACGATPLPDDPVGTAVHGALRAVAEAERAASAWRPGPERAAPLQVLARLHVAAAAGRLEDDALGRPRRPDEAPRDGGGQDLPAAPAGPAIAARLDSLADLLRAPASSPAVLVAALAHAEVAAVRPFLAGNGVVARALARAVVVSRGLDPRGAAIWEAGLLELGPRPVRALRGYARGEPQAVGEWLACWTEAVVLGAAQGTALADAVLAGRLEG
jgi:hypothetical protein